MQLFNAESHAIGVKPVHGIDDAISCDNIALLEATLGSQLFTLQFTEIMSR